VCVCVCVCVCRYEVKHTDCEDNLLTY